LGPEYNLEELRQAILLATGVKVALRYRIIRDSLPVQVSRQTPQLKAIHIEVDSKEPKNHRKWIGKVFSTNTKEFPVGIKMRLVAEISLLNSNTDQQKAEQLQALQARFLATSGTWQLYITLDLNHDKHCVMASLQRFLLHNPLLTPQEDQLFYAVSPVPSSDKVIVRFLPKHKTRVDKVIDHLARQRSGLSIERITPQLSRSPRHSAPEVPTCPRTLLSIPVPALDPQIAGHQEALDKYCWQKFCMAFELPSPLLSRRPSIHSLPILCNLNNFPCKHVLHRWLRALRKLFQNTAWDKWRYQIGILWEWRDPVTLAPCSNQSAN